MPFKKGDPNINRKGRLKGSISLVDMLRRKLKEIPAGEKRSYAEHFIETLLNKALIDKDTTIMKDIIDRVDGKPKQSHELSGKNGEPLNPTITVLTTTAKNNITKLYEGSDSSNK